ncbi:ABC transporter permease [Actinomadura sp. WMMB 499]|uniref:ABC transporter permease n=1 Tax=Actinomadura sp. WMMB 499 TaxID=1219491 RepID=UPI0012453EB4|nr:ABC transporter permease [Actinomadura sp. WMMB 499]QFG25294.1 ABC transporter permease [Actinomadura sp. WMMB 499]
MTVHATPDKAPPGTGGPPARRPRGRGGGRTARRLLRSPVAVAAAAFIALLALVALLSPFITPHDPARQDLMQLLRPPSAEHWLGTDSLGRDNLSRLIEGTRVTVLAAVQAIALAVVLGFPAGLLAGFVGRRLDTVLNWISDVLLSLPSLILALAIVGILGPGLTNAMIAVGITLAPRFFRVARGAAYSVRNETYVEACVALGFSTPRILFRHVLPNASGPLLVQTTFALGLIVTAEASLSFLGLGARPPTASWGSMLRDAFDNIYHSAFPLFAPSLMIVLTILAFSALGDALRDALGRQNRMGA